MATKVTTMMKIMMVMVMMMSSLQLPYFMNELTLTELDMGSAMPQITAASRPEVNRRGSSSLFFFSLFLSSSLSVGYTQTHTIPHTHLLLFVQPNLRHYY